MIKYYIVILVCMTIRIVPAAAFNKTSGKQDTISVSDISSSLKQERNLIFPSATFRLYSANGFKALWLPALSSGKQVRDAMLLFDTAIQYGLDHHDYHPDVLTYANLRKVSEQKDIKLAARMDILLTDAMLGFINHLHYGKLNPFYSQEKIDKAATGNFSAQEILQQAFKHTAFNVPVLSVQPASEDYRHLQNMLRLITGQYTGDSYQTSIETVKLIAVNLERWRWEQLPDANTYVVINIPAFNLRYYQKDSFRAFRVIVGKPGTPTPVLTSSIGYFTTAPDWTVPKSILIKELLPKALRSPDFLDRNNFRIYDKKGNPMTSVPENIRKVMANPSAYTVRQSPGCDNALGQIVFNFPNNYSVYLHDTPDKSLFNKTERAFSHGCIRLEDPEEFARVLLKADNAPAHAAADLHRAMQNYRKKRFTLKTPVPLIIRYLTCEMQNGELIVYSDPYLRDRSIAASLFGDDQLLAEEIREFIRKKEAGFGYAGSPVVKN